MEEKKLDFEKELKKLEDVVSKIQNEEVTLDESILLYEEGNKIIKELQKALSEAQEKVENIVAINKK